MSKLLLCVCLLPVTGIQGAIAQTNAKDESLLKAAFIYNFAKFTRWPDNTWQEKEAPLSLCTAGRDELIGGLEQLSGKKIKERHVTIVPLKGVQNPVNCHLLYIATSEKNRYKDILSAVQGKPVLTVSELPDFGHSGGIIELYREKDKTRFIINLDAAREAGLVISSRLLNLAEVINNKAAQ